MTEHTPAEQHGPFVQAPVAPIDNDGIQVARLGTVVWIIATVVLWLNRSALDAAGNGWWIWVGVAGIALGVAMLIWATHRRGRGADH